MPDKTIRQEMADILLRSRVTAQELSQALSIKEKEVRYHLEHIARSMVKGKSFVVEPAVCKKCGFVFKKRDKLSIPSRCPVCKEESIQRPKFGIEVTDV